ncbi:tetraacyldisaccharide 4'-kinase [bacterium]|nr:tetraacyldisaccharide 4'-kinase [bacterium]
MNELAWKEIITGQRKGLSASLLRGGLHVASLPYGLGVAGRNIGFDRGWIPSIKVDQPVISVGNLTVGGTGKTPVVEWIARWFRGHGKRVAILSRGYGSADGPNDEALVLEENLPDVPHLQGADRLALARIGMEELDAEVFVLDDGFQHRRLRRDLDIVLIDASNPMGNGKLLPAGPLREPLSSLGRAQLILLTRAETEPAHRIDALRQMLTRWGGTVPIISASFPATKLDRIGYPSLPASSMAGRKVAAFCGIGNPNGFRTTLTGLGAQVVAWRAFPDHYPTKLPTSPTCVAGGRPREQNGWSRRRRIL